MRRIIFTVVLPALFAGLTGCVDLEIDEPPVGGLPNITANTTIQEIKSLHEIGEEDKLIETNAVIRGIVVADDESGNFYKKIILQDKTGGIVLWLNAVGLYNSFPIGREVFVKCRGLYVGDDADVIRLSGGPGSPLEEVRIPEHVIGGARDRELEVEVDTVTLENLDDNSRISTLIHVPGVEFMDSDTSQTFSNVFDRQPADRVLADCNGNFINLYSSGYAKFGHDLTPTGRGGVTGIFGVNWKTAQLYIREPADLYLYEDRCEDQGSGAEPTLISIRELRNLQANGATTVPPLQKINGVVISDKANGNTNGTDLIIQDGASGIVHQFAENHPFALGEQIEVDVSRLPFSEVQGLLHIINVPARRATSLGQGTPPEPRTATIAEVRTSLESWESTLVRLEMVRFEDGGLWKGENKVSDASGSAPIFTLGAASFAEEALPEEAVDLIAIVSQAVDLQFSIRNLDDVINLSGPFSELYEPFTSQQDGQPIDLPGWHNIAVKGERLWEAREFNGNVYAQATAYNDDSDEMEAWLITPQLILNERRILSLRSAQAFFQHPGLTVWISKDFNGDNFHQATWTLLDCKIADSSDGQNQWIPSGDVDLDEFRGTVYIGFRYLGNNSTNTTTFWIDDIKVRKP